MSVDNNSDWLDRNRSKIIISFHKKPKTQRRRIRLGKLLKELYRLKEIDSVEWHEYLNACTELEGIK